MDKRLIKDADVHMEYSAYAEDVHRGTKLQAANHTALPDIFVTRPYLPPLAEFLPMLEQIWTNLVLTNSGPYHAQFERRLSQYLEGAHISLVTNGTVALSMAIAALGLEGEIVTTPYSFIATSHAAKLSGLSPVFADVRPSDLNIDPAAIEAAITCRTSSILAVHCYGSPCDVDAIQTIADKYGLKIIYDAAHAFGVHYRGRSIVAHGDMTTLSFHATKAFTTFEGEAVVSSAGEGKLAVDRLRNFGIADETTVLSVGTNAKMSEFSAALGLLQLIYFEGARQERARIDTLYRELLASVDGIRCLTLPTHVIPNFSYFPILVDGTYPISRDELASRLKQINIHARRYFYPLISNQPMYAGIESARPENLPVANCAAQQILCLPIYPGLAQQDQERIITMIASARA